MSSPSLVRSFGVSRRARQLWSRYGVFWLGAIAVGLVAVLYARLIDWGYNAFRAMEHRHAWLPLLVTPAIGAACVWLTRRFFRGAEGCGMMLTDLTIAEARDALRAKEDEFSKTFLMLTSFLPLVTSSILSWRHLLFPCYGNV